MSQISQSYSSFKLETIQKYIMQKNYKLAYSLTIDIYLATILFIIRQMQILSLLSIPSDSQLLTSIPNLSSFFTAIKIFSLKLPQNQFQYQYIQIYINSSLCLVQLVLLMLSLIPNKNIQISSIIAKIITIGNITLPIPTTIFFFQSILQFQSGLLGSINMVLAFIGFFIMLINYFIYVNFHFCFSIKDIFKNVLVRLPKNWIQQFSYIFLAGFHKIVLKYGYPNSFIVYLAVFLGFSCYRSKKFAIQLQYIQAKLSRNIGIMNLLDLTISLALIFCYFDITLFYNSLTSFVISFYLFFVNFFLTFRKYWIKKIIIDDNTPTEISQITYVVTFIIFSIDRSQKKNETYISSLLKNHCNNCKIPDCCCKNRDSIYDPAKETYGSTKLQPHLDSVFVKHYFLKMIEDSIIQFPNSLDLKLIIGLFHLQFLQLSSQCIKHIRYLNTKTIFQKLSFQQKFILHCLEQQFCKFVQQKNRRKGDKKVQDVKLFDEYFNDIVIKIMKVTENFKYFWKNLNQFKSRQINPQFLNIISTKTLNLTEEVYKIYQNIKNINPKSLLLKQYMFFYSKQVVNDIDLFVTLKKQLKMESFVYKDTTALFNKSINIFSNRTANLLINGINSIVWASNNAKQIFGFYSSLAILKSSVNNLMPDFFGEKHDAHMKNWLQTGVCTKMNNTKIIWCQKQNGSCFKAAIYIKFMPNLTIPTQKDIEYFTSVQVLSNNQIICGNDGEIYGCDKSFRNLMKCSLKGLQNLKPNIKIFFPYMFEHFLNKLIPKSLTENKRKFQEQCSGYIPEKIIQYLQNFNKEKEIFINKNKSNNYFNQLYSLYLELKMQQITTQLKGKYVTVDFQINRFNMLGRQIVVLIITRIQKDTVERYFNQLQRTIKKMTHIREKVQKIGQLSVYVPKVQKSTLLVSPLQFCLNMKRVQKTGQKNTFFRGDINLANRKQRAINQMIQIKNQRVRQNLYKLKKALYANKIISANVLRILTQAKQNDLYVIEQDFQCTENNIKQQTVTVLVKQKKNYNYIDQQNFSNEDMLTEQNQELVQRKIQKDEQQVSFQQSTASSAGFISMSTKIRMLKQKLRQIRPNKWLIAINYLFIIMILLTIGFNGIQINRQIQQNYRTQYQQSQKNICYKITQSLMSQKIIIDNKIMNKLLNRTQQNKNTNLLKQIFHILTYEQLYRSTIMGYSIQKYQIKPNYIQEQLKNKDNNFISSNVNIFMWDFFLKQYNQLLKDMSSYSYQQYKQIIQLLRNKINQQHISTYYKTNMLYLIIFFVLLKLCTFLNLHLYQKKIFSIIKLISQLYPTQRQKYLRIFYKASQKLAIMVQTTNIIESNKNKTKHSQALQKILKQPYKNKSHNDNNNNKHTIICMQIWLIFIMIYLFIIVAYGVQYFIAQKIKQLSYSLDNIAISRLQLTYNLLLKQSQYKLKNINIVQKSINLGSMIILLYNGPILDKFSPHLQATISHFSTTNVCHLLQPKQWFNNIYKINGMQTSKFIGLSSICQQINNSTFKTGILNSYSYIDETLSYYSKIPPQNWPQQYLTQIIQTSLINSLLSLKLLQQFVDNKQQHRKQMLNIKYLKFGFFLLISIMVLIIWRCIYLELARLSSMHNRYLLMLPFDLLIDNPYLRQFLKTQFEFKSNLY